MSDPALSAALAALRPPAPDVPAQARALFRSTLALSVARPAPAAPPPARVRFSLAFFAVPTLALLLLTPLLLRPVAPASAAITAAPAAEILAELEHLFPGQLHAFIDGDNTLQLELSALPASSTPSPADQAVVLEFTRGSRRLRILAYSGKTVHLRLDEGEVRFAPLLTGSGQVLLTGDDFAWTLSTPGGSAPRALAGWQITARPLAVL